jgi:hypothetical protein
MDAHTRHNASPPRLPITTASQKRISSITGPSFKSISARST